MISYHFVKDPCDDFYTFACGRYNSKVVIPEHKSIVGAFDITKDALNVRLKNMFEDKGKVWEIF